MISKKLLALAMMMGAAGEGLVQQLEDKRASCISNNVDKIDVTQHVVVPKGAKQFFFGDKGLLPTVRDKNQPNYDSPIGEVKFSCVALSKKRAIKKWEAAQL